MSDWGEKYRDLNNQKKNSNILSGIGVIMTLAGIYFFIHFFDNFGKLGFQNFDWQSLILFIILLSSGIPLWNKGKKLTLKRNEDNFLIFWKAYKMLEKFNERKTDEDMKSAVKCIKNIADIFSGWFRDNAPKPISSMTDSINDNLRGKIISLIKEKNYLETSSLATKFMNMALNLDKNEIDRDFLNQFKEELESFPDPKTTEKQEIKKGSRLQDYPLLRVFWIGIITGIALFFSLTSYMGMESGPALIGSFLGGVALTAMIMQGIKKK